MYICESKMEKKIMKRLFTNAKEDKFDKIYSNSIQDKN